MTTNGGTRSGALTPQQLFDQGDFRGAVDALLERVESDPTDADRRLLAESLLKLDDPDEISEALFYAQAIEEKDAVDYVLIGWCNIQLKDWYDASVVLEQALELGEFAWSHYLLALAYAEGRPRSEIDAETLDLIEMHLRAAIALPDCGPEAFLWLEKLQGFSEEGIREKINILQAALQAHAHSVIIRQRLAQVLIEKANEPEEGLRVLEPLLAVEDVGSYTAWLACAAWASLGDNARALDYLNPVLAGENDQLALLSAVKGVLMCKLGAYQEALTALEQAAALDSQTFAAQPLIYSGLARAHLGLGNPDEVKGDVARLVALYKKQSREVRCETGGNGRQTYRVSIPLDGGRVEFDGTAFVAETCKTLVGEASEALSQEDKGWLSYVQYCAGRAFGARADAALLMRAAEHVDHPALNQDLIRYFLVEAQDVAAAVKQHLASVLRTYAGRDTEIGFDASSAAFQFDGIAGQGQPVQVAGEKDRARVHQIGMVFLLDCADPGAVQDVFIPFYRSFWREMLVAGAMYDELEQVTDAILAAAPEAYDELFDYAFSLHKQERLEQAERAYRELLVADPDSVPALHNLALVMRDQGALDEALALSDSAVALAPEDEVVVALNQALRERGQESLVPITVEPVEQAEPVEPDGPPDEPGEPEEADDWADAAPEVVAAKADGVVKPIFNSRRERRFYDALISVFPNYLVFPNMACSAIFDFDQMKELIGDGDEFRHFLMAIVDFCVVSTTDYLPMVAFEVDSSYHDNPERMAKDEVKDKIFQMGGVPLIRWRPKGKQGEADVKREIIDAVQQARIGFEVNGGAG